MTGGGFGGCVLALIDLASTTAVDRSVRAAFTAASFAPPATFIAHPAQGATPLPT
jgi:galactokinase